MESAKLHGQATENGNSKQANRAYDRLRVAVAYLDDEGRRSDLLGLTNSEDASVKMWAATFLLPTKMVRDAVRILEMVGQEAGIIGFDARMTLQEWNRGNLRL